MILLGSRVQMVKAVVAISIHQEVDRIIGTDLAPWLIRLADNSNSRRRKESCEAKLAKDKK